MGTIATDTATITVALMNGMPNYAQDGIRDMTFEGLDGHEYLLLGLRGEPWRLRVVIDAADQAAALQELQDLAEMVGALVTVTKDDGSSIADQMLMRATALPESKHQGMIVGGVNVDGAEGFRLVAELLLQDPGTT